jgi:L-amino acid N-acyltransferase YncA
MITVRYATKNDLQQTLDIYNEIIANSTAIFQYEPQTLEMRKTWFAEKKEKDYPVFVAEENNVIVGFSTFGQFRNWQAYNIRSKILFM